MAYFRTYYVSYGGNMKVTFDTIRTSLNRLDLSNRPICVHSSLSSFGWITGGAPAIIQGFLAGGCTIMVPTFSPGFHIPPPPGRHHARNGLYTDLSKYKYRGVGRFFTPESTEINKASMGALPVEVVSREDRVRGGHPLNSFSAIGSWAHDLIDGQSAHDVYYPLRALMKLDGFVLMMGVGLDKMTLLHLAERLAGRNLFRRWVEGPSGRPVEVEIGSCSRGFQKLSRYLAPVAEQRVGQSLWRVFRARDCLSAAVTAIRANQR